MSDNSHENTDAIETKPAFISGIPETKLGVALTVFAVVAAGGLMIAVEQAADAKEKVMDTKQRVAALGRQVLSGLGNGH